MAEATDQRGGTGGTITWELPTRGLPAVETRDLPEPRTLSKYVGASVTLTATAMGSGESIMGLAIFAFLVTVAFLLGLLT